MDKTGIFQVHSSCKSWVFDPTTTGEEVSYSYAGEPHEDDYDVVDVEMVKKLVEALYGTENTDKTSRKTRK